MANEGQEFDEEYAGEDSDALDAASEQREPRIGEIIRDEAVERGKRFATDQLKKRAVQETGKQVAKETGKQVAKEATKQVAKQGAKLTAEAAVPVAGWVVAALDLGWSVLSNPKTRRLIIASVVLFLGTITALGFLFFIMATRDSTPPDAVSAANEADMDNLRLLFCIDKTNETNPDFLSDDCQETNRKAIESGRKAIAEIQATVNAFEDSENKTKAASAIAAATEALNAIEAAKGKKDETAAAAAAYEKAVKELNELLVALSANCDWTQYARDQKPNANGYVRILDSTRKSASPIAYYPNLDGGEELADKWATPQMVCFLVRLTTVWKAKTGQQISVNDINTASFAFRGQHRGGTNADIRIPCVNWVNTDGCGGQVDVGLSHEFAELARTLGAKELFYTRPPESVVKAGTGTAAELGNKPPYLTAPYMIEWPNHDHHWHICIDHC